jgi:hypothetical protein
LIESTNWRLLEEQDVHHRTEFADSLVQGGKIRFEAPIEIVSPVYEHGELLEKGRVRVG